TCCGFPARQTRSVCAKIMRKQESGARWRFVPIPWRSSILELHLDQARPLRSDGFRERLVELVGGGYRAPFDAHAPGERNEVDRRAVELQHVLGALAGLARADAVELAAKDLIDPVRKHDGDDVQTLAGLRPQ